LLKKKHHKYEQTLLKLTFKEFELLTKLKISLYRNQYLNPEIRLRFSIYEKKKISKKYFFKSIQKLICLISLNNKVPNKKYFYSRFYLNKQLNRLTVTNTFK
jgi:hypothetical protein